MRTVPVENYVWAKPLDIFEKAFTLECEYREHLEKLVILARQNEDELTALEMAKLLDMQVDSCNDFEVILNKARQYSAL